MQKKTDEDVIEKKEIKTSKYVKQSLIGLRTKHLYQYSNFLLKVHFSLWKNSKLFLLYSITSSN